MFVWPVVALAVILLTVWLVAGVRTATLRSAEEARAILAVEHPGWHPAEVACAADGGGALAAAAPPDDAVAVVFAHGDTLTSRLLHRGDLARMDEVPAPGAVRARLYLHDLGCPHVEVQLAEEHWRAWRPRLQRLVGAALAALTLTAATGALPAQEAARGGATVTCPSPFQASWTPQRPPPGSLFSVEVVTYPGEAPPGAEVAGEPLHFSRTAPGRWRALAAAPIDSANSLGVRFACPGGAPDSATARVALASAHYPLERLRVAPRFSAPPDSALQARMRREAARAAEVSRASHATPRLWTTPFRPPRTSRITSSFGRGREFNGTVTSRHMGTDYAGAVGAPVRAANRGVVRIVDRFYLGGNVVYLDHGEGLVTAYLHLSKQGVAVGDTVVRGAIIGLVGATGRVTGPHLHWIARYGGVTVDPVSLLRATASAREAPGTGSPN
ncbi:MAG TPA: M23 family metallopeptidase [Gemmatimonadaceae bacterium]|nr:M23 family metallopeptidase [Gemmatimonadaceae bacterium]